MKILSEKDALAEAYSAFVKTGVALFKSGEMSFSLSSSE